MLVLCAALGRSRGAAWVAAVTYVFSGVSVGRGVFSPHPAGHGASAVDRLGGRATDRLAGLPPRGARGPLRSRLSGRGRLHHCRGDRVGRSLDCARGRAARRPPARRSARGGRRARSARRRAPDRGDGAVDPAHQPGGARDDARRRPALLDSSLEAARARRAAPARWSHLGARRSPALGTSAPQRPPERDLSDSLRRGVCARRGVSGLEVADPRRPLRARSSLPVSRGGGAAEPASGEREIAVGSAASAEPREARRRRDAGSRAARGDRVRRLAGAASAGALRARAPGGRRGVRPPRGLRRASAGTRGSSRHLPDPRRPGPRPARRGQPASRALRRPAFSGWRRSWPSTRSARGARRGAGRGAGASDTRPGRGEPPHRPFVHGGGSLRAHRLRAVRRAQRSRGRATGRSENLSASAPSKLALSQAGATLSESEFSRRTWYQQTPVFWDAAPFSTRTSTRAISRASRACGECPGVATGYRDSSVFFGALGLRLRHPLSRSGADRRLPSSRRRRPPGLGRARRRASGHPPARDVARGRGSGGGPRRIPRLAEGEVVARERSVGAGPARGGTVRVVERTAERLSLDLEAPDPTWLFVLRAFWPYRTLELDGAPVEPVPAQLGFSARADPRGPLRLVWREELSGTQNHTLGPTAVRDDCRGSACCALASEDNMKRILAAAAVLPLVWACSRKPAAPPGELADVRRPPEEWLREESIRLLRDYVRIDTNGRERRGWRAPSFSAGFFECEGIEAEIVCPAPGRCNVLARAAGPPPRRRAAAAQPHRRGRCLPAVLEGGRSPSRARSSSGFSTAAASTT